MSCLTKEDLKQSHRFLFGEYILSLFTPQRDIMKEVSHKQGNQKVPVHQDIWEHSGVRVRLKKYGYLTLTVTFKCVYHGILEIIFHTF